MRCPICGMLTYLRNLGKQHKLQIFRVDIGGKIPVGGKGHGRAKGRIVWEETKPGGVNTIEELWLKYLLDTSIDLVSKTQEIKSLDTIIQKKITELFRLTEIQKHTPNLPYTPLQIRDIDIRPEPYIPVQTKDIYISPEQLQINPITDIEMHIEKKDIEVIK